MACIFLLVMARPVQAQKQNAKLRVVNRVVSMDTASNAIRLNEVDGIGIAWLLNEELSTGEIEFDIKGVDRYQGSFVGLAFHGADDENYEVIYFRPFNFRAADSVRRSHGVQYIASPNFDWPLLRERFPGKYEKGMPSDIDPNGWFHVKLVLLSESIAVYVNNGKVPVLTTKPLLKAKGKMIGYFAGTGSSGEWKNLRIKK